MKCYGLFNFFILASLNREERQCLLELCLIHDFHIFKANKEKNVLHITYWNWNDQRGPGDYTLFDRLVMKEETSDYLELETIKNLVKKYSQFISFPIYVRNSKVNER